MNFLMTAAQAEKFFQRCMEAKAVTLEERTAILKEMAAERLVFEQSDEQLKKRLHGKKVMQVKVSKTRGKS